MLLAAAKMAAGYAFRGRFDVSAGKETGRPPGPSTVDAAAKSSRLHRRSVDRERALVDPMPTAHGIPGLWSRFR